VDEEEKQERINNILDDLNQDIKTPPYNNATNRSNYTRTYKQFKEEEIESREKTQYEKLCNWAAGILTIKAGESTREKYAKPLKLLGWDVTPGMIMSASIMVFFLSFLAWFFFFAINFALGGIIPTSLMLIFLAVPVTAAFYTYSKPVYAAKNKVIRSSGEMILSILYMVVYMRSSPNLEGAIRFAALNLEGPISKDLKEVLWSVEVGKYNQIDVALEKYTERWKDYNDDFLESLNLLRAAMNESDNRRRDDMLQDAIDNILDGTEEKMKHYAQSLETPVMILNAMGAMLPVLGMIMLPLISTFLGGVITPMHLFIVFNILLPAFLYWFMQRTLSSRPPTVATNAVNDETLPPRGKFSISLLGRDMRIPSWPVGLTVGLIISIYGIMGYISLPVFYPAPEFPVADAPGLFVSGGELDAFPMLLRSLSIVMGVGLGIGITRALGNRERRDAEEHLEQIESQFPNALFELGNKISGGTPIELALEKAGRSTSDLEISDLFMAASQNIREMGMTFEESIFDDNYGALRQFPSQMIKTVMKATMESSQKGTNMASTAMMTISRYLQSIHKTQEQLNDLMDETTTTIEMLAYLLAPVVSGVAVGMSQTIITALFGLSRTVEDTQDNLPSGGGSAPGGGMDMGGMLGNLDTAIPPELLQFVVGIYLIQLLHILGTFYMKIKHGEDETYRNLFIGKILISGITFYTITALIISVLFGGLMGGLASGVQ
jgi:Flp pilus assembly protein TadB